MSTPTGDQGGAQPDGGQYGAGQYPGGAQPAQAPRNGLGTTGLVLGIIGLILTITFVVFYIGGVLGLLAIIFSALGLSRVKKGQATNRGVAIGGLVTGILALLGAIVLGILTALVFNAAGGSEYLQCIQNAGGDQAKVQQCVEQAGNQLQQNTGG